MSQPKPKPNDQPKVTNLLIKELRERDRIGIERYGTSLQPFNGRDPLRDLLEEVLDAAQYLTQLIYERDHSKPRDK